MSVPALLVLATAILWLWAASARADQTVEYVGGNGSDFATSVGGWTSSAEYDTCVLGLTCVPMNGSFTATGGSDGSGDGYLRMASEGRLATVLSSSHGFWRSPSFVYNGVGGNRPDRLEFSFDKRSGLGALLALGVGISYQIDAVNLSGGSDVNLVPLGSPGSSSSWHFGGYVRLSRSALKIGDQYRIQVKTNLNFLAGLAVDPGFLDFDNISLEATEFSSGGPQGPPGTDGTVIHSGNGAPSPATGSNGDFYIDLNGPTIYGPKAGGAWPSSGIDLRGPQGTPGADGNTILSGTGAPASGLGKNGDFYIDTAAQAIYGPKTGAGWGTGVSIKGQDGAKGSSILSGAGTPSNSVGSNGDYYIDQNGPTIYGPKAGGAWPSSGLDLTGPQGPKGADGAPGTPGTVIGSGEGPPQSPGAVGDFYLDLSTGVLYGPWSPAGWGSGLSIKGEKGDPGPPGPKGEDGKPAPSKPVGTDPPPAVIPPGIGYLYKNRLHIRVKCPRKFKPRCRVRVFAITQRHGRPMTKPIRVTVKSGKWKKKALPIKPAYLARIKKLAKVNLKTLTVYIRIQAKKAPKRRAFYRTMRVVG